MKRTDIANLTLFLLLLSAFCATLVSGVHSMTAPIIAEMEKNALEASYAEIYPAFDKIEQVQEFKKENGINGILIAEKNGHPSGIIYNVTTNGYAGQIDLLLAFDIEKSKLTGAKILKQAETPGLGANAAKPTFMDQFKQKDASKTLKIVKATISADNEVQAVTAATITSRAVVESINNARTHFIANYQQGVSSK